MIQEQHGSLSFVQAGGGGGVWERRREVDLSHVTQILPNRLTCLNLQAPGMETVILNIPKYSNALI